MNEQPKRRRKNAIVLAVPAVLASIAIAIGIWTAVTTGFPTKEEPPAVAIQVPMPAVNEAVRAYADCTLGRAHGPYLGHNSRGHVRPQLMRARCRLLEPAGSTVDSGPQFEQCYDDHTRWAVAEYDVRAWPNGFESTDIRLFAETVCAPAPPSRGAGAK